MINPILGESFAKSANLDRGKNGLASIGGANVSFDSGLINTGMNLANSLQLSPMLAKQAVNDMFDAGAGKKVYAVESPIQRDKNGNIIGGGTQYTTDPNSGGIEVIGARSGGLYGNHKQAKANEAEQEQRAYLLNQQKIEANKKEEATISMYQKMIKDTNSALKNATTDMANDKMKAIFGENSKSFDDINDTLNSWFMNNIGGYDLKTAVQDYDNGTVNSGVYKMLREKGYNDQQIKQVMSIARQVFNTDVEKRNAENGNLSRENTARLANDIYNRLGQKYNSADASYLAQNAVLLGSQGIENKSAQLENAHLMNRLHGSQLHRDAIVIENNQREQRRHNLAMERIGKERNKILSANGSNEKTNDLNNTMEKNNTHIIDWEKGSSYGYNDNEYVVITDSNNQKWLVPKGMYTLENDGKTLKKVDGYKGDTNIIQLKNGRLNQQEEDKMIETSRKKIWDKIKFLEDNSNNKTSLKYKQAEKEIQEEIKKIEDYTNGAIKIDIDSSMADIDNSLLGSLGYNSKELVTSAANLIYGDNIINYRNYVTSLPKAFNKYRTEETSNGYSAGDIIKQTLGGIAGGAVAGSVIPGAGTVSGGVVGGIGGLSTAIASNIAGNNEGYTQKSIDEISLINKDEFESNFDQDNPKQQSSSQMNKDKIKILDQDIGDGITLYQGLLSGLPEAKEKANELGITQNDINTRREISIVEETTKSYTKEAFGSSNYNINSPQYKAALVPAVIKKRFGDSVDQKVYNKKYGTEKLSVILAKEAQKILLSERKNNDKVKDLLEDLINKTIMSKNDDTPAYKLLGISDDKGISMSGITELINAIQKYLTNTNEDDMNFALYKIISDFDKQKGK